MLDKSYSPQHPFIKSEFAHRLKQLRLAKELSITDMAALLGVERKTYSSWEKSTSNAVPKEMNVLLSICELLNTTPLYLLTGLFGEQKDREHTKTYMDIYERYKTDMEFHFLVTVLMTLDSEVIAKMGEFFELIDAKYRGNHPLGD